MKIKKKCILYSTIFKFKYPEYRLSLILIILNSLYGGLFWGSDIDGYFSTIFSVINCQSFNMFTLFIIIYNTIITFNIFNANYSYIIRLKNKKQYLIELLKAICINNFLILLFQWIFIFIVVLFSIKKSLGIEIIDNYDINNCLYILFAFIKNITLIEIIGLYCGLLLTRLNKNVVIFIFSVFNISLLNEFSYSGYIIDSYSKMPLFYGSYLSINNYNSFINEVHYSLVYITMLFFVLYVLFNFFLFLNKRYHNDIHN